MLPYETNKPIGVILFDINGDPVEFPGGGGGGDVNVLNFPATYPLPEDQVTALTPPPAITGFATETKQDDVITELQALNAKDFSTQTTLAAILAKIITAPSTEAKQDDVITLLTSLTGVDFASDSKLQDILDKLIVAPATEPKQDTIINLLDDSSDTGTGSSVNDSATNVTLLSANANRRGASFYNDSSATLYLKCGSTASLTSFTIPVEPRGYYELPFKYAGIIDGIWSSAAGGAVRITEFT